MPKTHFPQTAPIGGFMGSYYEYTAPWGVPTGNVLWVNSLTGTDSTGYGMSPDAPFASIAYAVKNANKSATGLVADNGDTVVVLPNHTETVTGAGGVTMDVAGVTVIGLGYGRQRPKVNFTTAVGASFDVTAARCSVLGLYFVNSIASQTAMMNLQGADLTVANCEFDHGNASNQAALVMLGTSAADRLLVDSCFFHGTSDAGTSAAISLVGGNNVRITNNVFTGSYNASGGVIKNATTDCLNLIIAGNLIQNVTAANTKAIVLTATSTGQIANNRFQILSGTAPITGAAMSWVGGNYYAATIATAGTLI